MRDNSQLISFFWVLDLAVYIGISPGEGMSGFQRGCVFLCAQGGKVQIENRRVYVCHSFSNFSQFLLLCDKMTFSELQELTYYLRLSVPFCYSKLKSLHYPIGQ